jgi:hypothetical protein
VLVLSLAGRARGQDPAAEATAQMAAGRYDLALEEVERIPDARTRAEWRFHVLSTGGDLPGALASARAGLAEHPESAWLLENAARAAVSLGLGREAVELCARLLALEGLEAETAERGRALRAEAQAVLDLERRGARGVSRARAVSLAALGLAALVLVLGGRRLPPA